ncbi:hypothetical protein [Cupriavidus sp. UYPR2.512]|uniref:hypothetical protein n=1 Tax=Cupriavidus sp. UYPR2.512 TaxID=1080187 RepID=UPI00036C5A72|nr:hypothetical protein [Cupriavidus sp. UYPR2.512]UIF89007.1 hypothetical protein KAF44_27840 [Cupriavidus necator]
MISINREWWEHLSPKVMHQRLREMEALLRKWCSTDYGARWLSVARQEGGVLRVKPGQLIPVVHFVALGDRPIFIVPQQVIRVGHRMVGMDTFLSGRPLEEGELALRPEIRLDIVQDPVLLGAAARGETSPHIFGVKEPSLVFSAPAPYLLSPKLWPRKASVLYQHIFGSGASYPDDGFFYVGVTTRRWQTRWAEHRRAMETGSPLLFHRKLREEMAAGRVTYIHHKVMGITDDIEKLYATEEWLVEGHWNDARRLNMIPGGKSGLRYLRENGMLAKRVIPLPDEGDSLLSEWLREQPRKGLPAPWVAEKWKDDAWAIAQICSRDDRLSIEQVRAIRELVEAHSAEEIADRIGARSADQVQRVIAGKTYTRVS